MTTPILTVDGCGEINFCLAEFNFCLAEFRFRKGAGGGREKEKKAEIEISHIIFPWQVFFSCAVCMYKVSPLL